MALTVSVVIPTYNRVHLIARAVTSALANVAPGDEVIVVDDGSTDDTLAKLAVFGDRIRAIRGRHAGAGAARNTGIAAARGDLVAFLDSDDEWLPNKLALQRALFEARPDVLFCFSDFAVRTIDGREVQHYLFRWHRDPRPWDEILAPGVAYSSLAPLPAGVGDFRVHIGDMNCREMQSDYIATFTVAVRRVEAGAALHYAQGVPLYEDWECFGRLAGAGTAAYLDVETARNHGHGGSRLTDADTFVSTTTRLQILEHLWGRDAAFLARHGEEYRERRACLHRLRARLLLTQGRTREARAALREAGSGPLADRLLASLPGFLVRGLFGVRRLLRG